MEGQAEINHKLFKEIETLFQMCLNLRTAINSLEERIEELETILKH
jgi:hypothetical protein